MKKLRNILAACICASVLLGCQYNIPGISKKTPTAENKYIPQEPQKQTIIEETLPAQPQTAQTSIKIALLVPLSGTYKELGQGLLDAAQLAIFKIGDENLVLMPIDSKDSTTGAIDAAKKAASSGAKIILGPVFSSSAKAIAKIAADNNIQVVSFSNDKSLANSGVFAIGFLPEQQIRRIVNFSISKGIKDYITMLPTDSYGATVTKELQNVMNGQEGVALIKNEDYQLDAKGRITRLDEHARKVITAANTPGAKAILLPAGTANAVDTAAILASNNYDKSKIQLLASDQVNDPAILKNPALEGMWFTASSNERRSEFEGNFRSAYGHDAPKLAGLAYDGIALVATVARISGDNFSRDALTNPRGFIGVDGIFRLRDDGLAERGFAVMMVNNGKGVVIDPAPASFGDR